MATKAKPQGKKTVPAAGSTAGGRAAGKTPNALQQPLTISVKRGVS